MSMLKGCRFVTNSEIELNEFPEDCAIKIRDLDKSPNWYSTPYIRKHWNKHNGTAIRFAVPVGYEFKNRDLMEMLKDELRAENIPIKTLEWEKGDIVDCLCRAIDKKFEALRDIVS